MYKAPGDGPVLVHICALLGSKAPQGCTHTQGQHSTGDAWLATYSSLFSFPAFWGAEEGGCSPKVRVTTDLTQSLAGFRAEK